MASPARPAETPNVSAEMSISSAGCSGNNEWDHRMISREYQWLAHQAASSRAAPHSGRPRRGLAEPGVGLHRSILRRPALILKTGGLSEAARLSFEPSPDQQCPPASTRKNAS